MSWPIRFLAEVAQIRSRKPELFDGARRYYSTGAVGEHGELDAPESVTFSERPTRANCMPRIGDVGFARMNGTKKVVLITEAELGSLFSTGFCFLEPNDALDSKYLFYFLTSESFQSEKNALAGEGIMGGIKNSDVANMEIPLPPLAEQQRIVRLLDEAFEGIAIARANVEKNLQNVRVLFESHLASIYSEGSAVWPAVPLGEICDVLDNLRKPVTKRDRVVGPYPYYGATGVVDHVANFLFDEPLVLVGEDGAKWGPGEKSAFLVSGKVWVNNHAHVVRPHRQRVLDQWLVFYLTHIDLNEYVSGLTVPKLNQGSLREIPIPLPKIAEQQLIVDTLKELEASANHLAETYAAKLRACEELSASLLNQAFSGNLKAA